MSKASTEAKNRAFRRLDIIAKLYPGERVASCMRSVIPGHNANIFYSASKGVGSLVNVFTCNNIWMCPVCARKRAFQRRAEFHDRLQGWEGVVFMYHLTERHNGGQHLADLYSLMNKAHHLFKSGRWYQGLKKDYQIVGSVESRELTFGLVNGWHPHIHGSSITTRIEIDKLDLWLDIQKRWLYCLKKVGGDGEYDVCCKVTFREKGEKSGIDYPIKWGIEEELTLGSEKEGRGKEGEHMNMFQLVERGYIEKNPLLLGKYREFIDVYKGTKQLRYDKGLKKVFKLSGAGSSPESIGKEGESEKKEGFYDDFEHLLDISSKDYNKIVNSGCLVEFLKFVNSGDVEKMRDMISQV
jgi:hypothetical protein